MMDTLSIRQSLHNYIEFADPKKIRAIYTMLEEAIHSNESVYSEAFKAELDARHAAYLDGAEKVVTADESKNRVAELLKAGRRQ